VERSAGQYAIHSQFAAGAMGTIHFGRLHGAQGFRRTVAVKKMRRDAIGNAELTAMFVDEARVAARIVHPNVVQTYDVVVADEDVFVVMEYVSGESLAGLMKGGRIPSAHAVSIVTGVLRGLHAAHEATDTRGESLELVHRDVSPGNVLVGVDGIARILDFGVAKATGRLHKTRTGNIKGKLAYMPPEQLCGEPLDQRADIYAVGVVLWEALVGRRLFATASADEMLERIVGGRIEPPSASHPDLTPFDAVVLRALAANPEARFATAREMMVALERCGEIATQSEVGALVEEMAAESIRARSRMLEAIEAKVQAPDHDGRSRAAFWAVPALALVLGAGAIAIHVGKERRDVPVRTTIEPTSSVATVAESTALPVEPPVADPPIHAPPRARAPAHRPRVDCEMPFSIDLSGHKHYKRECTR
jgi:serine/threonine-protein kinase